MKLLFSLILVLNSNLVFGSGDLLTYLSQLQANDPSYGQTQITTNTIEDTKNHVKEIFYYASAHPSMLDRIAAEGQIYSGYTPADLEKEYDEVAEDFLANGYTSSAIYNEFKVKYAELLNLTVPAGLDPKEFWLEKYFAVFDYYLNKIKNNPVSCAPEGVLSNNRKCCTGLLKLGFVIKKKASCSSGGTQCQSQSDCCSGVCKRENTNQLGICADNNAKSGGESCTSNASCLSGVCNIDSEGVGSCESPSQCYSLAALDAECTGEKPYCGEGKCIKIDKGSLGGNICKKNSMQCSSNSDCCSDKCNSGTCVENAVCKKCVGSGAIPSNGNQCCPGYYLNPATGRCNNLYNPLYYKEVRVKKSKKDKNLLFSFIDLIFPTAHAAGYSCSNGTTLSPDQITLLNNEKAKCQLINPGNEGTAGVGGGFSNSGVNEKERCLMSVEERKNGFCGDARAELTTAQQEQIDKAKEQCISRYPQDSTDLNECLKGVMEEAARLAEQNVDATTGDKYGNYIDKYKTPTLRTKTYSDIEACEFHSYNDVWKQASNSERNAELFLRSFEYIHVGQGTQDYWQDGSEGNIFKRTNEVAKSLRVSRSKMMKEFKDVDKQMTCQCLAAYGLSGFPKEKQDFYLANCSDIETNQQENLATGTQESSNIGSQSITSMNKVEKDNAKIEEVDKGASGITYETLLRDYLALQAGLNVKRFEENSDNAQKLISLSEFIQNTDFEEVKKDSIHSSGGNRFVSVSDDADTEMIYRWGRRYPRGFWRFFANIFTSVKGSMGSNAQGVAGPAMKAAYGDAFPELVDSKTVNGKAVDMFTKWDGFERYYVGPKFDNKSTVASTRCNIKSRAAACLRSAYAFEASNLKYLEDFPSTGHYIVDPKLPPFVNNSGASKIELTAMPGINKTWVQVMNDTVEEGKNYLKGETTPDKLARNDRLKNKSDGGKTYRTTKSRSRYIKKNIMQDYALRNNHFVPLAGQYQARNFGSDHKTALIDAAKKYAMCKELEGNSVVQDCNGSYGATSDDIGFGHLFESDNEAREWAEYTYEMHYVYSTVSSNDYLGYPLLGANFYYEATAFKIRLLHSIYLQRAQDKLELLNLIEEDLRKRVNDYQSLGEAGAGTKTKNLKYSPAVFKLIERLNFSGNVNLEQFDQMVKAAKDSGGLSKGDLGLIGKLRNNALGQNALIAKKAQFDEGTKKFKSELAGLKLDSNKKKLLNPIQSIVKANKGGGFARGSLGNKLDEIDKKLASLQKKRIKSQKPFQSAMSPKVNIPSYSAPTYQSSEDDQESKSDNGGMSVNEADILITRLKNNKDYTQRNDSDTLWAIVSKAYKRNYSRVLTRSASIIETGAIKEDVTSKENEELKELLNN